MASSDTSTTKGRSLVTKADKKAAKAAKKKGGNGDSTRVAVPTEAHFDELIAEITAAKVKAFKTYAHDDFVALRALCDRGYRWARKLYESPELAEQSKTATKAAKASARAAEKAAEAENGS